MFLTLRSVHLFPYPQFTWNGESQIAYENIKKYSIWMEVGSVIFWNINRHVTIFFKSLKVNLNPQKIRWKSIFLPVTVASSLNYDLLNYSHAAPKYSENIAEIFLGNIGSIVVFQKVWKEKSRIFYMKLRKWFW